MDTDVRKGINNVKSNLDKFILYRVISTYGIVLLHAHVLGGVLKNL